MRIIIIVILSILIPSPSISLSFAPKSRRALIKAALATSIATSALPANANALTPISRPITQEPTDFNPKWRVPTDITSNDDFTTINNEPLNVNRRTSTRLASTMANSRTSSLTRTRILQSPFSLTPTDLTSSLLLGTSIYLASSSRNSPLITYLGSLFYGPTEEWVKERNEGLFASPPPLFLLSFIALLLLTGVILDRSILLLTPVSPPTLLSLSIFLLLNTSILELCRVDMGAKKVTKVERDERNVWVGEFEQFANERIIGGGGEKSCHKKDVVRAFRRYYGKYRVENSIEGGPTDMEIEGLFVEWNKSKGTGKFPTKAGFVKGLVVKEDVLL